MLSKNNIFVTDIRNEKNTISIINNMRRRPAYVQNYCILYTLAAAPNIKLYQVARITELDYYQAMKRIEELSRNQFINVRNGNISITERGIELMQILERLIFLMHADNPESNNILG
jgi:predicted transcriptional regulator